MDLNFIMVFKKNAKKPKALKSLDEFKNGMSKIISKKIQKENPRRAPVTSRRVVPKEASYKKYYTIEEDAIILKTLAEPKIKRQNTKGSSIIAILKQKVGKTEESIRNRMKRYLKRLSQNDTREILK